MRGNNSRKDCILLCYKARGDNDVVDKISLDYHIIKITLGYGTFTLYGPLDFLLLVTRYETQV